MLSGRGLCDELITRPEESYRMWCVVVCDLETSRIGAPCIYDICNLRVNHKGLDSVYLCSHVYSSTENVFIPVYTECKISRSIPKAGRQSKQHFKDRIN